MAGLFRSLGFGVGHESVFSVNRKSHSGYDGDSSALAVPLLDEVKRDSPSIVVFHITRHPLMFIRSQMAANGLFDNHFGKFLLDNAPDSAKYQSGSTPTLAWSASFWMEWNRKIEEFSDYRVRLERVDDKAIHSMLFLLKEHRSDGEIRDAVTDARRHMNTHASPDDKYVEWNDLRMLPFYDELVGMAKRYRYRR